MPNASLRIIDSGTRFVFAEYAEEVNQAIGEASAAGTRRSRRLQQQLADVPALEEAEQGLREVLDPLDDVLTHHEPACRFVES